MIYMGSKRRIAKYIIPLMVQEADKANIKKWIEPFVGGANLIDKVPERFERVGYDLNEHVIYALKDIRDRPNDLPNLVSFDEYTSLKGREPASISSWIRFVCSFGGRFDGGVARGDGRNFANEGKKNAIKQSPYIQGVDFIHSDYASLNFSDCLIYCDPPYQSTTGYKTGKFNHDEFFEWCRLQAKNNIVFVSEYDAPDDFEGVW